MAGSCGRAPRPSSASARVARCAWSHPKDELAGKLATAARVASAKSTIQILSHVLLRAEDGRCELASTDMELSLRVPLEATAEEPGAVVLPRLAGDIVRSMADGPVTLEHRTNEGIVQITGGGSSFSLNCLQAHDFPELPADEGSGLTLPSEPLVEAIDRVARAASRDETRPVLTGVLLRLAPEGMTMVATDSYRLAVRSTPLEAPPPDVAGGDRPGPRRSPRCRGSPRRRRRSRSRSCSPRARRSSGSATCA